jgi:RNA polymerase sigma-70 factor (ECF subfamily)
MVVAHERRTEKRYEFTLERTLAAPPAEVFDAMLDPQAQLRWWGGDGEIVRAACDLRVGGVASIAWGPSEDALIRAEQVFREIDRPKRLVYDETVVQSGSPVYECRLTFTFAPVLDQTRLVLHHTGFPTPEERDLHEGGTGIFLDRLQRHLERMKANCTLRDELRTAWYRYLDLIAPQRPALHAYARRLTRTLWDAEDLVQDTLLRGFGHLGHVNHAIRDTRSYLLRTATNVWIDELRRREREPLALPTEPRDTPAASQDPEVASETRAAGTRLLQRLSPQERAAVLLKEMFEMSLEEIAELLATTTGAVKAALHRGRERLRQAERGEASRRPLPSAELLDRFVDRCRAKDLHGLAALLLDGVSVENVGEALQFGRETFERTRLNILWHVLNGHAEWPPEFQPESVRLERAEFEGEAIVLAFATQRGREALRVAYRFEEREGRIARLRIYGFCPETMRALGETLRLPVVTGLYHAPEPALKWRTG